MAQKLILFEDIINGSAMKSNKALMEELGKLAKYVFDESDFATENVAAAVADDIQIWSGDELHKAIANDYCKAFRFKSSFEIQADGYVGPVMAWFFEPDGAFDDQIIVLTCESDGIFKNPRYVCGLLISEYDLDRLIFDLEVDVEEDVEKEKEKEDADDDDDDDWDVEIDDEDGDCKIIDGKCVIPDGVTRVPYDLVNGNKELEEVDIPGSVEVINDDTFSWCSHLVSVKLHDGLKKIGDDAFLECISLRSINLPSTLVRIGDTAFSGCRNLQQLVIPDSVRVIGEDAFEDCNSLERIYIKNTELLEDAGLNDDVEIITEFDEQETDDKEEVIDEKLKNSVLKAIEELKQENRI